MKLKNEDLVKYFKLIIEEKRLCVGKVCPSPKLMGKAFMNKISRRKKLKIVDHISWCSNCAREFEFLREIFKESQYVIEELEKALQTVPKTRIKEKRSLFDTFFPRLSFKYASLVSGILILLVVLSLVFKIPKNIYKDGKFESFQIITIKPMGEDTTWPITFEWKGPKAKYYILEIYHEQLYNIWISPKIYGTYFALPPEIIENLSPGKIYFWKVTAFFDKGKRIESYFQDFKLS